MSLKHPNFTLTFLGKELMPIETAKDLALIKHIIKSSSSCMSCLGQINRVEHALDKRTLISAILNVLVLVKYFTVQMCGQALPVAIKTNCKLFRILPVEW